MLSKEEMRARVLEKLTKVCLKKVVLFRVLRIKRLLKRLEGLDKLG